MVKGPSNVQDEYLMNEQEYVLDDQIAHIEVSLNDVEFILFYYKDTKMIVIGLNSKIKGNQVSSIL